MTFRHARDGHDGAVRDSTEQKGTGMAEDTTESTTPTEDTHENTDEQLGEPGVKALHAERKARAAAEKHATQLEQRIKEFEQSQLSDLEKAQTEAREYQEAAAKSAMEALRWKTAAAFGINDEDAEVFLTGGDEETIVRQAERLSALAQKPTSPKPDLSQGSSGLTKPPTTAEQFADQLSDF